MNETCNSPTHVVDREAGNNNNNNNDADNLPKNNQFDNSTSPTITPTTLTSPTTTTYNSLFLPPNAYTSNSLNHQPLPPPLPPPPAAPVQARSGRTTSILKPLGKTILAFLGVSLILSQIWLLSFSWGLVISLGNCSYRFYCGSPSSNSTVNISDNPRDHAHSWTTGVVVICPWSGFYLMAFLGCFLRIFWLLIFRRFYDPAQVRSSCKECVKWLLFLVLDFILSLALTFAMYFPSLILGDVVTGSTCYRIQSCQSIRTTHPNAGKRWISKESYATGWGCVGLGGLLWLFLIGYLTLFAEQREGALRRGHRAQHPAPGAGGNNAPRNQYEMKAAPEPAQA